MTKDATRFLLYIFGFLLLWEWLRPIEQLTETDHIWVFVAFALMAFLLAFFNVTMLAQFLIKTLYVVYALYFFYFEGGFFKSKWVVFLLDDLKNNVKLVMKADWYDLSDLFRSLLFFILLWLMTYLIQYWLLNRQRIFIFFFMTLIYITVLDTFTTYRANSAIIRTVVIGFVVMGMLTFFRLLVKERLDRERAQISKWMIPLAVMIALSTGIGYLAPKAAPIWPDPVPYLKSYSEQAGGGNSVKKIGYGTNDSQLGGPFIGDNSIVYRIRTDRENYWKVENKDIYTGKGWEVTQTETGRSGFLSDSDVPVYSFVEGVKTKENIATVMSYKNYDHLIYPIGVKRVDDEFESSFEVEPNLEKIYSLDAGSRPVSLNEYIVVHNIPSYSVTELMKNPGSGIVLDPGLSRYLQLPDTLPQRVRQLAVDITKGKNNWFDQARAIENYFDSSEFTYDQKDVAVPKENEDYVDQFLFDTKKGYCDNFSSSMVVLLRSIGIPARWVKGYTEGEFKEYTTDENANKIYEITNNNAHSWVEAYFPNQGWVTFEPTKGYSTSANFDFDNIKTNPTQSEAKPPVPVPKQNKDRLDKLEQDSKTTKKEISFKSIVADTKAFFLKKWKWILLGLVMLAAFARWIYTMRGRWMPHYLIYRYKFRKKDEHLGTAYLLLLQQLERYGIKRKEDQTLRHYASYVDSFFSSREMSKLTAAYEQLLYKQELADGAWRETKQLWENLIKKTIA